MKIYISGPITGMKDSNKPEFDMVAKLFGIDAVNPFDIPCEDKTWRGYMKADITELVKCDCIAMLRGWWHSKGAWVELLIAKVLGIKILWRRDYERTH